MKTYKTHLYITDKTGNFKRYACNLRGYAEQDGTHDLNEVTCARCAGKTNPGLVVKGFGTPFSKRLKPATV